jgi:hypothetical protein
MNPLRGRVYPLLRSCACAGHAERSLDIVDAGGLLDCGESLPCDACAPRQSFTSAISRLCATSTEAVSALRSQTTPRPTANWNLTLGI